MAAAAEMATVRMITRVPAETEEMTGRTENAQLAVSQLALLVYLHRFVDAQILMVPGEDLGGAATGVVIKNEILKQIHEVPLVADTPEHGFQRNGAFLIFF